VRHGAIRLAVWTVVAVAAAAAAPPLEPLDGSLARPGEALAAGVVVGVGLFATLARRPFPTAALGRVPRPRLAARSTILAVKSAEEEALWRGVVLGGLAVVVGRTWALAASSVLFAAAHVPRQRSRAVVQLATGSAFGVVYVTTGRLLAAIAAHTAYNVLVGAATLAERDTSTSSTGDRRDRLLAS
jgi:membrane protease YdiL (CAAX protease family)